MAGIGFELRKLARRDDLMGVVASLTHASVVSTGPWIMTVLALGAIDIIGLNWLDQEEMKVFRIIVIYNFGFSLVAAGPLMMVATRYLADRIYEKKVTETPGMLIGGFIVLLVQMPIVGWFYGYYAALDPAVRVAAIANYFVISFIWYVGIFLSALRDFRSITIGFAIGMSSAFAFTVLLGGRWGAAGMLTGFSVGLTLLLSLEVARVLVEFPYGFTRPFAFLRAARKYWELTLGALFYNLAVWIDKWIMWTLPDRDEIAAVMISYPLYDSTMFLAYMTVIPAIAVFVLSVETDFFERYQNFYKDVSGHAPWRKLTEDHQEILASLSRGLRNVVVFQGCITAFVVLAAPNILSLIGVNLIGLGMFRLGVIGSFFHVLMAFVTVVLAYFDLRRKLLFVYFLLFVTNTVFSLISTRMGFAYYGYGFFLSALVTLVVAYVLAAWSVGRLPYLTFIANNPSVKG
ncbi:MAG: exopolysaccharide Pel transporter PelG [Rhodospirillaceae bacterium]|nr:exopolysaccharide Pel transporter PelG [Rhodospirillaceae bacterium]